MKIFLPTILISCWLTFLGCRTPNPNPIPYCILGGGTYEGLGVDSELKRFDRIGIMDTVAAMIDLQLTLLYPEEDQQTQPVIGGLIAIKKAGQDALFIGGVTDINGRYDLFLKSGNYDLEFSYTDCNTLTVKNVELLSGMIYEGEIRLGVRGSEQKTFVHWMTEETKKDEN